MGKRIIKKKNGQIGLKADLSVFLYLCQQKIVPTRIRMASKAIKAITASFFHGARFLLAGVLVQHRRDYVIYLYFSNLLYTLFVIFKLLGRIIVSHKYLSLFCSSNSHQERSYYCHIDKLFFHKKSYR